MEYKGAPPPPYSTDPAHSVPYPVGPPPPGMMPPPGPSTHTVVVVQQPTFGQTPIQTTCPHCNQLVLTEVKPQAGTFAWLLCGILFIFACWLCCCIPFCVDSCQDAEHFCPQCRRLIYRYHRL